MKLFLAILLLFACGCAATERAEISGNEEELRATRDKPWNLYCWNIRGRREAKPFLTLAVHGERRVADLKFPAENRDYLDYEIPFENERYGPFPGEEITSWQSPYKGGSDFKITDGFTLILPVLHRGIGQVFMGSDRDSQRKNGFVEIRPRNQGIQTTADLHCESVD